MTRDPFSEAMEAVLSVGPSAAEVAARRRARATRNARLRAALAGPGFGRWVDRGLYFLCFVAIIGTAALVLSDGIAP